MSPDQVNQFFSFLYTGTLGSVTFWVRLVAGVLTSALAAAIAVILIQFRRLVSVQAAPVMPPDRAARRDIEIATRPWQEVQQRIGSASPVDWNFAVIQADAIFDAVLKDMGLAGETMGDRLKRLDRSKLAALDDVWEAHKLRNRIVHETDRVLSHEEAARAVTLLERALRELSYLQE